MRKLFTSEAVTEGHPDKLCDRISDSVLDEILSRDPQARVACETFATTGLVVVGGEISTECYVDIPKVVRDTICEVGYDRPEAGFDGNTCAVLTSIDAQSPDIDMGVSKSFELKDGTGKGVGALLGAGDQGMMFGYACNETDNYMPLSLELAHLLLKELAQIRKEGQLMQYLRPDSKSQVTIEYGDEGKPVRIHTIVISTQHDDFIKPANETPEAQLKADEAMVEWIRKDIVDILLPRVKALLPKRVQALFDKNVILFVNPTGKFVIGGPHGDTGLTGRKIIVDTYGGKGAHGGGAFSGKDPSKVDRSAAYAARHIAKNMVAAGIADEILIQISYAIGVARPVGVYVNTYGTSKVSLTDAEIAGKVSEIFDLRPRAIEERLKLCNPIYQETASYGHMGRKPEIVKKVFTSNYWPTVEKEVELFTWEKLDYVDEIKRVFKEFKKPQP